MTESKRAWKKFLAHMLGFSGVTLIFFFVLSKITTFGIKVYIGTIAVNVGFILWYEFKNVRQGRHTWVKGRIDVLSKVLGVILGVLSWKLSGN